MYSSTYHIEDTLMIPYIMCNDETHNIERAIHAELTIIEDVALSFIVDQLIIFKIITQRHTSKTGVRSCDKSFVQTALKHTTSCHPEAWKFNLQCDQNMAYGVCLLPSESQDSTQQGLNSAIPIASTVLKFTSTLLLV